MTPHIPRREMLRRSLGALLAAGVWPGRLSAQETAARSEDFSFIAVNDLHYFDEQCGPWFAQVVAEMKKSAPGAAFALLAGDLANDGKPAQFTGLNAQLKELGMPRHAVPGNHDHTADNDRTAYLAAFPDRLNYVFEHGGWQFIAIDSTQGADFSDTLISDATYAWLAENLPKLDAKKPTVIFTHFPLGEGVEMRPVDADKLLERFTAFNLQAAFCGHWHGYSEKPWAGPGLLITNRCCARVRGNRDGSPRKGWWVCEVKEGKLTRRFADAPPVKAEGAV